MATAELVVTELGTGADVSRFDTSNNLAYYTDDWGFEKLPSANIPVVSATAETAAGGIVTVTKTFTAPEGITDASVIKLTATKDGTKSYIGSTLGTVITVPEAYRTGYTLAAEITPIASSGYIGNVVTIDVPAVPEATTIVGITLTQADGSVTVATDTALTNAQLIFVIYDANDKMVDWEAVSVTLDAQGTDSYAPADLTAGTKTKAMLWADMVNCVPLADAIAY